MTGNKTHFLMKQVLFTVLIPFLARQHTASGDEYIFVDKSLTWTDALEFCMENGTELADLGEAVITPSIYECLERFDTMWTEKFTFATPYLSILGCFSIQENITYYNLSKASVLDCQYEYCSNSSFFAMSDKECFCLENVTSIGDMVDARLCNITCDGTFCGGQDTMNIYYVVNESFFQEKTIQRNPNLTSCLSYQCLNHDNVYKEVDCHAQTISQTECSNYFSCTFEPGEPCFLYQDDQDDFDWTIQNKTTQYGPMQSYEGSYFAFVDDEQYSEGNWTALVSNIGFSDGQWCIRLRYYIQNISLNARLDVYKTGEKPFFSFMKAAIKEWKYAEKNLYMTNDERVIFNFTRGREPSNFALDDIIMTKGSCNETVTAMFKMKGEINCDFEGNKDICFLQNSNKGTWMITRDGSTPTEDTGPDRNIEGNYFSYIKTKKAVLISSFYLEDIRISFSMQYSMYGRDVGELYVYLKDESNTKTDILRVNENKQEKWTYFTTNSTAEGKTKLYIEGSKKGTGTKGDIEIDDIKIIINERSDDKSWMAYNKRCARILGSYTINDQQITDLPCLTNSSDRWAGIIRPQRRGSAVRGIQEYPTAVQLYRYINNITTHSWEMYDPRRTRPFVCKRGFNSSVANTSCVIYSQEEISITGIETTDTINRVVMAVIACGLTLIVGVTLWIAYYRRMQRKKKQQKTSTGEAVVYDYSDETFILKTYSSNEANIKELKSEKISQESGKESKQGMQGKNIIENKGPETEYDHLHVVNKPSTSTADSMYSKMKGNQNGLQILVDDTYDHTIGMESNYGTSQINHNVGDFYDQAHGSETLTSSADDMYSHVSGDKIVSHVLIDDTYDQTMEHKDIYGAPLRDDNMDNTYDQPQVPSKTRESPKNSLQDSETVYDQAT